MVSYIVYLKEEIANQIIDLTGTIVKQFTVSTLTISNGLLKKHNYRIPIEHILFIEEVP